MPALLLSPVLFACCIVEHTYHCMFTLPCRVNLKSRRHGSTQRGPPCRCATQNLKPKPHFKGRIPQVSPSTVWVLTCYFFLHLLSPQILLCTRSHAHPLHLTDTFVLADRGALNTHRGIDVSNYLHCFPDDCVTHHGGGYYFVVHPNLPCHDGSLWRG